MIDIFTIFFFWGEGVRELFEQEPPPPPRKTRGELMKDIDADYYGYRDDDDGVLLPIEMREEKKGTRIINKMYINFIKIYFQLELIIIFFAI